MALPLNRRIARIPHLDAFLAEHPRALAGWGRKPSGRRAAWLGRLLHLPHVLLEDGFLRSVGNGPLLSLLIDDLGAYYDAGAPSRMEATIAAGTTTPEATRAEALRTQWLAAGLSKYNAAPDYAGDLPADYVLVADQCWDDAGITGGLAGPRDFAWMLAAALSENPGATVLVKIHPEVQAGRRSGALSSVALAHPRVRVIGDACHPIRLIAHARAVYAVTSAIGFEALLRGKPVRCFGMPFYAGWGLTHDAMPPPPRRAAGASLVALIHAAFIALPRYVDPHTGALTNPEAAIAAAATAFAALRNEPAAA